MENSFKSYAVKVGIMMGIALAVVTIGIYSIDLNIFMNPWIWLITLLIIVGFGLAGAASPKKFNNGYASFKECFTGYVIAVAIGLAISTVISIILFTFIDPDAATELNNMVVESTEKMMVRFGAPEAEIEEAIAKLENNNQYSLGNQIKSYFTNLIFPLILGLIVSLIVKKSNPELD